MTHYEHRTIDDVWDYSDTLTGVAFEFGDAVDDWSVIVDPDGTITGIVTVDGIMPVTINTVCYVECDDHYCVDVYGD